MTDVAHIVARVSYLRRKAAERDQRWSDVLEVRKGNINKVFPGLFPDDYPKPLVANFIDTAARDISEVIAPLPAMNCNSTNTVSDRARTKADKRTMIVAGYRDQSRLQTQMFSGADRYITFGMVPFVIEIDHELKTPIVRVDNPIGAYPDYDRFGRLTSYTKRYLKTVEDLCAEFPEHAPVIRGNYREGGQNATLEMYRYHDKDTTMLYLPGRANYVLAQIPNPIGKIMVVTAVRPGVDTDETMRGQFDDVLWVQVARSRFATLSLEAAQKSVQAPYALPADVNILEIGPDATIRSASPEKIRRVDLNVPPGLFQESAALDQEMRVGSRYPEGRSGAVQGSIVTGRGVEALMGGFDTQVKTAQQVLAVALKDVMALCFEVDEKMFGNVTKTVRGVDAGSPYEITYTPNKDIAGEHIVDVTYGLMAGLNPNQALVFGLQARGDKLISRDFLRRQMPWEVNVTLEEQKLEIEQLRDGLLQAVNGYAQAIPILAQNGQDPGEILKRIANVIEGRLKGGALEEVVMQAFAPEPTPEQPGMPGQPGEAGPPGAPGMPQAPGGPGGTELNPRTGMAPSIVPGQAGMGPGGRPAMQQLLAGIGRGGNPSLAASVVRSIPAG
jgi:hypothetical protein